MFNIELKVTFVLWEHFIIWHVSYTKHVLLVALLNNKTCYIPLTYWCPIQIRLQYNGMFILEIMEHMPLSMFSHSLRKEWQSHFVSNCDFKIRMTDVKKETRKKKRRILHVQKMDLYGSHLELRPLVTSVKRPTNPIQHNCYPTATRCKRIPPRPLM
jgi:hypothetical protein